tara:strand:- start:70 stop:543 length:474 start_codon:yes stop_codon:yes gene_type:complete
MNTHFTSSIMGAMSALFFMCIGWWVSQPAQAIPQSISIGSNPLLSWAGQLTYSSSSTVGAAPSGQDVVLTDIILTTASYCGAHGYDVTLTTSSGTLIGQFRLSSQQASQSGHYVSNVMAHLKSGLIVPAGESLSIATNQVYQDCKVSYTLSGYLAQP